MERAHHLDLNLLQGACFGLPPVAQGPRQARHLVGHLLHEPLRAVAGYGTIRHALLLSRMVGVSDESYPLGAERSTSCQFMTAPTTTPDLDQKCGMTYAKQQCGICRGCGR